MSVINTNVKSLYTQAALKVSGRASADAMQQLSTGKRINSAKDDAAGLAIATRMTQQIRSLNQAMRNAGDAVSLIQTAEGATTAISDMLLRMRELSIQSSNGTNSADQRGYLDLEFQQLKQEIVRVADTTEWNGFPILNGTAGERVGERPVYKVTSNASFNAGLNYSASAITASAGTATVASGMAAKSGHAQVVIAAGAATAQLTFTLADGNQFTDTGTVAGTTVTFAASPFSTAGMVLNVSAAAAGVTLAVDFSRAFTAAPAMASDDIRINGVTIGETYAADDLVSTADSASGSAIARAAAINRASETTGVAAVVNANVMTGSAMGTGLSAVNGTVTVNGFISGPINTSLNNTRDSRVAVVNAINAISAQTGVVATDSGNDREGIRLEAADGRNIELAFNTEASAADFATRTGLKEGLQVGTYSLETTVQGELSVTSPTLNWARTGLQPADYAINQSVVSTAPRPAAATAADIHVLGAGDLTINGVPIRATLPGDDTLSSITAASSSRSASAIAIAAAINASSAKTGVSAVANPVATWGSSVSTVGGASGLQSLFVNGTNVQVTLATTDSTADRLAKVITAVTASSGQHGLTASESSTGGLQLTSKDGRNLSVWYNSSVSGLTASSFGLGTSSGSDVPGVTGIANATAASSTASTVYATVKLVGARADAQPVADATGNFPLASPATVGFTLAAGSNGFGDEGDFIGLGFQAGTFGGDVDEALTKISPPMTGRMRFQVGASANQSITIDLSDFGRNGPITGAITGDAGKNPPDVNISTTESAKAVLASLDTALDKVNATRATMGAVMNRLDYVVDNLTNVVTNSQATRSQIEDADYAAASTELSRTQIMQQAATAVLAQANTDQQTVLKLLQ